MRANGGLLLRNDGIVVCSQCFHRIEFSADVQNIDVTVYCLLFSWYQNE